MIKIIILLSLIIISLNSTQKWIPEVSGYSKNSGYAGIFGKPISSIRVSGNEEYRVRILKGGWLSPVTGNNMHDINNGFCGIEGTEIDGVAIKGTKFRVHILGEDWLEEVQEYDINNPNCGIMGKPIDAIMVKGRVYSIAYKLSNTNIINYGKEEVSQSTIVNCAKNQVGKYFIEGEDGNNLESSELAYYCHGGKIPKDIEKLSKEGIYIINPQPGDLLFWASDNNNDNTLHVSICIGNGMMIHAPNSTEIIQYTNYMEGENWNTLYKGARRYWN